MPQFPTEESSFIQLSAHMLRGLQKHICFRNDKIIRYMNEKVQKEMEGLPQP